MCEIQTLLPEEADHLYPDENRDLISLVTCTPYGVNTHRLIVTGERVSDADVKKVDVPVETADWNGSVWMRAYLNAILAGSAMMAGLAVVVKVLSMLWKKEERNVEKTKTGRVAQNGSIGVEQHFYWQDV